MRKRSVRLFLAGDEQRRRERGLWPDSGKGFPPDVARRRDQAKLSSRHGRHTAQRRRAVRQLSADEGAQRLPSRVPAFGLTRIFRRAGAHRVGHQAIFQQRGHAVRPLRLLRSPHRAPLRRPTWMRRGAARGLARVGRRAGRSVTLELQSPAGGAVKLVTIKRAGGAAPRS